VTEGVLRARYGQIAVDYLFRQAEKEIEGNGERERESNLQVAYRECWRYHYFMFSRVDIVHRRLAGRPTIFTESGTLQRTVSKKNSTVPLLL